MEDKIRSFKDLKIWQKGIEVVQGIYRITENFPQKELYSLTSQMRRAVVSIPSNIAEGFRRRHNKEYKQFLNIALGSCAELETQVIIARRLKYMNESQEENLVDLITYICKMTVNLIKKL